MYLFWPEEKSNMAEKADSVLVIKSKRKLMLIKSNNAIKTYKISLGRNVLDHKTKQGDGKTPEGCYTIDRRNPNSKFYLSLHVSYPNKEDAEDARKRGVPAGGDIMIHGLPNGLGWIGKLHRLVDWTDGCIAVTNSEMDEIWRSVDDGTIIVIKR